MDTENIKLIRKHDQVLVEFDDNNESVSVKIVWARPVTGRGKEVSIVDKDKKEILSLSCLDRLDPKSRVIATEELEHRYLMPGISKIAGITVNFGNRYWDVETNHGDRRFVMKDPNDYITQVSEDHYVIRDTLGNRYEIESFSALDAKSQAEMHKIM